MFMSLLSIFGPMILKMILGAFETGKVNKKLMKATLQFIKEYEEKDYEDQIELDEAMEENDDDMKKWIEARKAEKLKKEKV